jgi:hypothetical protein
VTAPNPGLFRLRAFEGDWLDPLRGRLLRDSAENARRPPLSHDAALASSLPLTTLLLVEGHRWIDLGQRVGYFAAAAKSGPAAPAVTADIAWLVPVIDKDTRNFGASRADVFARAMWAAQDDLAPDRTELLRLVLFATDQEWGERLEQLRKLANALRVGMVPMPAAAEADHLAWAFAATTRGVDGALRNCPASWRCGKLRSLRRRDKRVARRWTALASVLVTIARAGRHLADPAPFAVPVASAENLPAIIQDAALDASSEFRADAHRAAVLVALAARISPRHVSQALALGLSISDDVARAHVLVALRPHLLQDEWDTLIGEELDTVRWQTRNGELSEALAVLAPHLQSSDWEPIFAEQLASVRDLFAELGPGVALRGWSLEGHVALARTLIALVPRDAAISPMLVEDVLRTATFAPGRVAVIRALGSNLSGELLDQAFAQLVDRMGLFPALQTLRPHVPTERLVQLCASRVPSAEAWRARIAAARSHDIGLMAPFVPPEFVAAAAAVVRRGPRGADAAAAITELSANLSVSERDELLEGELRRSRSLNAERHRADVVAVVAGHLSPPRLSVLLRDWVAIVRNTSLPLDRVWVLATLAPYVPAAQMADLIDEHVPSINAIAADGDRAMMIARIAPYASRSQLNALLAEQVARAARPRARDERAGVVVALAPYLPAYLVPGALEVVRDIGAGRPFFAALEAIAQSAPPHVAGEVLSLARARLTERYHARVLVALIAPDPSAVPWVDGGGLGVVAGRLRR